MCVSSSTKDDVEVKARALVAIVGRERERARIDAFLERAAEAPAVLVLNGEPGIGKTTLWRLGVERAQERGFKVLTASVGHAERELSFAALGDLLAPVVEDLGSLPAPQRRALRVALLLEEPRGTPPDERALGTAMLGLLIAVAEKAPLLLAVDDVQWLDDSTRSVLRFALRRAPVAVLLAQRAGDTGLALDESDVIEVSSLGVAELDRILRAQLRAEFVRSTLVGIERASGGNPFFALEVARALVALPRPPRPTEPLPVPANLRELVSARLERLSPSARASALLAAAAARPTLTLLERAGAVALDELLAADVLMADGERIRFAHRFWRRSRTPARAYAAGRPRIGV
jgi:predicted ATPase